MSRTRSPLVISCQGGSPAARLATELSSALGALGVAEPVSDPERIAAAAREGRRVLVLDGCDSGCCGRLLDAKGVRPSVTLALTELEARLDARGELDRQQLAADVAARFRSHVRRSPRSRPRRPPARLASTPRTGRAHVIDDYLLALDTLASSVVECGALAVDAPTLAAHVSRLLGVSRASAGEMLARLEGSGLVLRGERKQVLLTPEGRSAADRAVSRHRLLERLATDFLGYPRAESYERARQLDGSFDDESIERVRHALGRPERCPHGWPIDSVRARVESTELTALSSLADGSSVTVVRVIEHDAALFEALDGLGLVPGALVEVCGRLPAAAGLAIRVDGTPHAVGVAVAGEVFVHAR